MIVTISGKPGSGKSTVAKLLAEKLGFRYEDMGHRRRKLAEEKGITLAELNRIGEEERWTDDAVDEYQKKLGQTADRVVVSGRTSFFLIPNSVKVFLDVDESEGARRITMSHDEGRQSEAGEFDSLEKIRKTLAERIASDRRRYEKYYGIDVYDPSHYDLVIDTTNLSIEKVVERIVAFLNQQPSPPR